MSVRINHSWQHGVAREIDNACPARDRKILTDRVDQVVLDDDRSGGKECSLFAVEQTTGADYYEDASRPTDRPPVGIGRDVVLHRTIIDKNAHIGDGARLVNERRVEYADGDGWCIRGGIVVVSKSAVIPPGTVV